MRNAVDGLGGNRRAGFPRTGRNAIQTAQKSQQVPALFVSRFLPGVRAVVPPFAGALRLPAWRVFVILAGASAVWYGAITVIAYRVGADWPTLQAKMRAWQHALVIGAGVVAVIGLSAWLVMRRRKSS